MKNKICLTNMALLLILTAPQAFALQCPDKAKAPPCPTSGTTLLDERYPTQSFVISNLPMIKSKESQSVPQQFIGRILKNYDFENVPQIILPITEKEDFNVIIETTKKFLEQNNISKEKSQKIIDQFRHVPVYSFTWQQDWFESFINLSTGSPDIRQIYSYANRPHTESTNFVANINSESNLECKITKGEMITSAKVNDFEITPEKMRNHEISFKAGEMGGNIEGAPGGFCLVGDNQGKSFTQQFCGDESNIINLQTSWLKVGHVDEIFKIIPTQYNDGRPKECEFSLMAASPKKALSLMGDPQLGNISFLKISNTDPYIDPSEIRMNRSNLDLRVNLKICNYITLIVKNRHYIDTLPTKTKSVLLKLFSIIPSANAQSIPGAPGVRANFELNEIRDACAKNLDAVSNFDMNKIMQQDSDLITLNNTIQESIENDKALIKKRILSRLPQCLPYYNEIDAPDLFYGQAAIQNQETKKFELPKPGVIGSFLPNPTNSVLMNKTITFPDSGNELFNQYLIKELEKRKMKSDFIPTWDYAHIGDGNIHCASHSLLYCRPQSQGAN